MFSHNLFFVVLRDKTNGNAHIFIRNTTVDAVEALCVSGFLMEFDSYFPQISWTAS